jgi:hypothetical protein
LLQQHRSSLDELERIGEKQQLAALVERLERTQGRHLRWSKITQPMLRKLVGKLLEDLVAAGTVTVIADAA